MPRIFPVPTSDPAVSGVRCQLSGFTSNGFTLIEVLVALLVATILTTATGFALVGALMAERVTGQAVEAEFEAGRITARSYLAIEDEVGRHAVEKSRAETKVGKVAFHWTLWTIRCAERPSIQSVVALRE
jgi:prepilin-type N-terminal cleavage/methylation domain-containing protein